MRRTILARTRRELVEVSKIPDLVATHTQALAALREIHDLPIGDVDAHEQRYRSLQGTHDVVRLRAALDRWCALWFWPSGQIDAALDPGTFLDLDTPAPVIDHLRNRLRFFHWELEFPDVFTAADAGFDAIVGNPPWETQKPNSMEFFSNIDPLYRTYDKQQALRRQRELFKSDSRIERDWLDYVGQFAAISNWFLNVAWPFGDGKFTGKGETFNLMDKPGQWRDSDKLHGDWRDLRKDRPTFADPEHPYQHQGGSDINSYKLFLEQTYRLLRPDGRLALLVPSGIYTDKATGDLRKLFLEKSRWTHLYALQNERFVFGEIDHRFKVAIVVVSKGGQTDAIETRFRIGPGDSPEAHEVEEDLLADNRFLPLQPATIREFSPNSGALLEIRDRRDLAILEKMYAGGVLLGDQSEGGWQIQYATEFHMTNDSKLFPPRAKWEAEGYRPSEYSFWLKGIWADNRGSKPDLGQLRSADGLAVIACDDVDGVALPFYQGVMVQPFDFAPRSWVSGTGLRAVWREIPWDRKNVGPQFLMELSVALSRARMSRTFKPGMRRVARSTDTRTSIASLIPCMPCGDKVSILDPNGDERRSAELVAFLGTFSFDWVTRLRSGGTQIDQHSLYELALPAPGNELLSSLCVRLNGTSALFARLWLALFPGTVWPWRRLWAVTPHERLRLRCILDAVVAHLYGLAADDFAWILRDCDHPVENVCNAMYARRFDPKGFWRVDKDHLPELRHPVLAQIAFHDLQARGLDAFLAQNDGEGWMLPETLRLADYDLGHDERARVAQPVAAALGPRFLPWQLEQSVDESWDECRRHAELIARIVPPPPPREPAQPAALSTEPVEATVAPSTPSLWPEGVYANIEPIQGRLIPDPAPEPGQRELFHLGPKPKRPRKK